MTSLGQHPDVTPHRQGRVSNFPSHLLHYQAQVYNSNSSSNTLEQSSIQQSFSFTYMRRLFSRIQPLTRTPRSFSTPKALQTKARRCAMATMATPRRIHINPENDSEEAVKRAELVTRLLQENHEV